MNAKHFYLGLIVTSLVCLMSCGRSPEDTGLEYAPAMYHSIPYEPYTQVTDKSNEYYNTLPDGINNRGSNLLEPVLGTMPRRLDVNDPVHNTEVKDIMAYDLSPFDPAYAAQNLKNPLPANEEIVAQGKTLYMNFCQHCHGQQGKGDGKVSAMYPGVPRQYKKTLTEGTIFHVITFGQGKMWPHGSQISPINRWKIVRFVQTLQ